MQMVGNSFRSMNTKEPKLTALQFNKCINNRDLNGLEQLMTEDHAFIDRVGNVSHSREVMVRSWKKFFEMCPEYKNTFTRIESKDTLVTILGHAYWSEQQPYDPVIWTATIVDDRVREWHIYADTEENRKRFNLL
jgi:predicted SnoaL-like aldol condensation-catalyzing enzyme